MPFATCDGRQHLFVIGEERASRYRCPQCQEPLRLAGREEFFTRLRQQGNTLLVQKPHPREPANR